MKKVFLFLTALVALSIYSNAQNTSPYWSLAGNSNATSSSKLGTTNANNLRFFTNNTERARITTSGLVGIGTTNPLTTLHVNGFGSFGGNVTSLNATRAFNVVDGNAVIRVLRVHPTSAPAVELISRTTSNGSNVAYWDLYAEPGDASCRIRDRQGGDMDRLTILHNTGYVGIGTTKPSYQLHVESTGTAIYGSGSSYGVYGSSSSGYGVTGSSGYLGVYGSGSTYGLYGSGGTYGAYASGSSYGVYGYSSGGYGVSGVSGSSYAVYGSGYIGSIGYGTYAGAWGDGDTYGLVGYGGPYGVWATGTSYAGYFQGNVHATGVYSGSDKVLKKNITEFNRAIDIINKLKPRRYEFRNDGNYAQMHLPPGSHYGLIAQDVEQVLPNLVKATEFNANMKRPVPLKTDQDGKPVKTAGNGVAPTETIDFKAVNYTELIPILIKAMQEQDAKITEQQTQNENLQNQVNELKSLVQALSKQMHITKGTTAFLKQNAPNPANNNTVIGYYIPGNLSNAQIKITDIKGSVIKTFNASKGEGQLNLSREELPAGTYNYTLYIHNKAVDTKQMILVR